MRRGLSFQKATFATIILFYLCPEDARSSWKQKYNTIEFYFTWEDRVGQFESKFRLPKVDVLRSYNKIKPVRGNNAQKIKIMEELYVHDTEKKAIRLELERFVEEDSPTLKPLSNSLLLTSPDKTPRGLASHALGFVQSLPYGTQFKTKTTSLTPIGVLVENKGDCDSKSSLLVAILKGMGINSRLLELPEHMVVGIEVPINLNDAYYQCPDGKKYVVAETTVRNLPLGIWDTRQLGKPIREIKPYKAKPPKLTE
jgi:transglutaminase-like putative cysteine protease